MTTWRFSEPNTGCGKSIVKSSLKPSNGSKRAHLSPSRTSTGDVDAQIALRRVLLVDAGRLQQEHERAGAAVHDRQLGAGDVDVQVVDAEARERRHQVLDGRDARAVDLAASTTAACRRRWRRCAGIADRPREIDAMEHDAGVDGRRAQRQLDARAGVQPDAGRA